MFSVKCLSLIFVDIVNLNLETTKTLLDTKEKSLVKNEQFTFLTSVVAEKQEKVAKSGEDTDTDDDYIQPPPKQIKQNGNLIKQFFQH